MTRLHFTPFLILMAAVLVLGGCKISSKTISQSPSPQLSGEEQFELRVGRNLMARVLATLPLIENRELQGYVNRVGRWIADQSSRPQLPWAFAIVDSSAVYAFSLPGGFVAITSGYYELLADEHQLASVLAREIALAASRFPLRQLQNSLDQVELEALATRVSPGSTRPDLEGLLNKAIPVVMRLLTEPEEQSSDLQAATLAARAGYDPFAMLDVLTTVASFEASDSSIRLYRQKHRATQDRIRWLDNQFDKHFAGLATPGPVGRLQDINQQANQSNP